MKKFILSAFMLLTTIFCFAQEVPADSVGIWADYGNAIERMDMLHYQNTKIGGGWAAGFTMGIAKTKAKLEFKGTNSLVTFSGTAHFRFYFGVAPESKGKSLDMFGPEYSMNDFDVAKFEVKSKTRLLTGVSVSLMTGSSTGVKGTDDVQVSYKRVRDGVYDVEVTGKPGQYCFIFTANGTGGFNGVYDFGIQ